MPLWFGQVNKRVFNAREIRKGTRPVVTHVGRQSGRSYETPLDVHRATDGTIIMFLVYGSKSDWVQNVMAAGKAQVTMDSEHLTVARPRIIDRESAVRLLPTGVTMPPRLLKVTEFLQMDIVE